MASLTANHPNAPRRGPGTLVRDKLSFKGRFFGHTFCPDICPIGFSTAQEDLMRSMDWPTGRVQTCIAGKFGVIRALRGFLANDKKLLREDVFISGYWKIGLVED